MQVSRVILIGVLAIILNACGGGSSSTTPSTVASASNIAVDAGDNKRVVVNESILIEGSVETNDSSSLTYEWKKDEEVLATTQSFTFTPTEAGSYLLSFVVQDSDGISSVDNMIVIVTTQEINTDIPAISDTLISEYLTAVNKARTTEQDCGSKGIFPATTTVTWNTKLYYASYEHMQDLINSKTFAHTGSGTESDWSGYVLGKESTQVERVETYGYSWDRLGENLAGGDIINSIDKAIEAWVESDNHCENLMNPLFEEVGMVMINSEESLYVNYWGQNFGTPK